jgi:hypothetical protein
MRGKDHLYYLIHSLSKSEKRYFTLDAQKSGRKQSRYLELFRFINQQSVYDEAALKKKFGRQLADDKSRLYEALLSSLRDYQSSKSYKTRIKELLTDAKILFERKLYEQCENRLAEAKTLALELEDHLAVLEINLRQRQLIKEYQHKDYAEQVEQLIAEKEQHLKIVEEEFWIHDNYDRLSVDFLRYHNKLNDPQVKALQEAYREKINRKPTADSFFSRWRHYRTRALYFRLIGDLENELAEFENSANIWPPDSKLLEEHYVLYLGDLFNLLSIASRKEERFEQFEQLIQQLRKEYLVAKSVHEQRLIFERLSNYELIYLINSKATRFEEELQNISEGIEKYKLVPSIKSSIIMNCVALLFLSDQYAQCINWIERLWKLNKAGSNIRQDIQHYSRILYLLAVGKSGTFEQMESALRSVRRYFRKIENPSKELNYLQKTVVDTLSKLQGAVSAKEEKQHLQALQEELRRKAIRLPGGLGEMIQLWLSSQLEGVAISELR